MEGFCILKPQIGSFTFSKLGCFLPFFLKQGECCIEGAVLPQASMNFIIRVMQGGVNQSVCGGELIPALFSAGLGSEFWVLQFGVGQGAVRCLTDGSGHRSVR